MVSTHGDLEAMKAQARDVYYGCKQDATESISNYKIRFEQAVQVLKEVGETVPSNVQPVSYTHLTLPTIYSV